MQSAEELGESIGVQAACTALIVPRSSFYRARMKRAERTVPKISPRAFSEAEKIKVRQELNSERFQDQSPREVYATLIDEGRYLCSWRSMYRILDENHEVRERRDQLRHPNYVKPELLATAPNQLWSWDITKLLGPTKWTYFYLYVILDVFSRYVVGWMIAERESAALAEELIAETCRRQGIEPDQLTIHADRGGSMTSKSVAFLLADLGVTETHSRPHVSNDNPYSEAQFKTLKYRPDYPSRFGCQPDARAWAKNIFYLVQPGTSSYRFGFTNPSRRSFSSCTDSDSKTSDRIASCLSQNTGTLRERYTGSTTIATCGLDQPANTCLGEQRCHHGEWTPLK